MQNLSCACVETRSKSLDIFARTFREGGGGEGGGGGGLYSHTCLLMTSPCGMAGKTVPCDIIFSLKAREIFTMRALARKWESPKP